MTEYEEKCLALQAMAVQAQLITIKMLPQYDPEELEEFVHAMLDGVDKIVEGTKYA